MPLHVAPADTGSTRSHRDDALFLDGCLRRLASQKARCRTVLGKVAAAFLARADHHRLGFARLGDYTRERLGLSAREVQSLATVTNRLAHLLLLREASSDGTLSWAKVRLLVTVATRDTEAEWLAIARDRTVRALEAIIRALGRPTPDDDIEPHASFQVACPRRVLLLWRDTVELARRVAGAALTQAQAAEVIAAEAASACPPMHEPSALASAVAAADPDEARCAFGPALDWSAIAEAIPDEIASLADDLDTADAFVLDDRMRTVVREAQRVDWQMGRLLRTLLDHRLYRRLHFPSAARYLQERLGMSTRRARALVALDRKTSQAAALEAAYRDGEISWVRALAILPVVSESTARAWVERAREVTVRRLVDEVEWAFVARDGASPIAPPPEGESLDVAERQMCARPEHEQSDAEVAFRAPVSVVALFRGAILAFSVPGEARWQGLERLLRHVKTEWESQPRHRDPIFARDGWRCATPACTSRRNLHDHHVLFRSRGGSNAQDNRITVCAWHHLRGIHAGRVRAWGEAPDGITWELGLRPDGPPLLRVRGDRYVRVDTTEPFRLAPPREEKNTYLIQSG